jgi:hypothetical protein
MWEQWDAPKENPEYKWPSSKNMITDSLMNLWNDFDTISKFYVGPNSILQNLFIRWRLPTSIDSEEILARTWFNITSNYRIRSFLKFFYFRK